MQTAAATLEDTRQLPKKSSKYPATRQSHSQAFTKTNAGTFRGEVHGVRKAGSQRIFHDVHTRPSHTQKCVHVHAVTEESLPSH